MTKLFMGIDPGAMGGLAIVDSEGSLITFIKYSDEINEYIKELNSEDTFCVIESQHAFPAQGITSMFTFGTNYGIWIGYLRAFQLSHTFVSPTKWMKHFGTFSKEKRTRKKEIFAIAKRLYPGKNIPLYMADAVMIARYAYEIYR